MPTFLNNNDIRSSSSYRHATQPFAQPFAQQPTQQFVQQQNQHSVCDDVLRHVASCASCKRAVTNGNNTDIASNFTPKLTQEQVSSIVIDKNLFNAATAAQASMWLALASIIVMTLVRFRL